jgi:hypothetical protein
MRNKILNIRIIEFFVFVVIWMAVFSVPFFNQRIFNTINWGKVFGEWISMFSFLLIFVLNTLWLVPIPFSKEIPVLCWNYANSDTIGYRCYNFN